MLRDIATELKNQQLKMAKRSFNFKVLSQIRKINIRLFLPYSFDPTQFVSE